MFMQEETKMKTGKKVTFIVTAALLLSLMIVPVLAVTVADINFEIDGNTAAGDDTPPGDDWESVILDTDMDGEFDDGPATLIQDGNSGPKSALPEQNIFAQGGKFGNPAGWTIQPGNVPAQNDLTNIYVTAYGPGDSLSGDSWIVMGMHRIKKQGTFDLDFEFNQEAWDGSSGTLIRTEGDVVVGFELSGNPTDPDDDLEVIILYYKPDDPDCNDEPFFTGVVYGAGFCEVFRGAASALSAFGVATMNAVAFDQPPWGAFDTDGSVLAANEQVEAFFFAEAAINLSELGIDLTCPGFGSVHAKSRSSLEVTADLKDLAGPVAFTVSCFIDGYKFHDLNADGVWQLGADGEPNTGDTGEEPTLSGWTIELYESGNLVDSTTTDANGYYRFDGLSDGTYTVQEVCPDASWFQSFPGPNPAASCGDNTHTFTIDLTTPTHRGNFGNYQNATKSGTKFKDADNSGTFNTGDSGLDGWSIFVYEDDGDGVLDAGDSLASSAVTAGGGDYSFSLTPGDYFVCEVLQANWDQTAPSNTVCAADPFTAGLADGGYAITLTSGQVDDDNDFGNTPLSNFDVNFYDLTGSTNATISCVDANNNPVGSSSTNEAATPETTLTANGQTIGTYTCTITITDP